jgi:hypothetical protein
LWEAATGAGGEAAGGVAAGGCGVVVVVDAGAAHGEGPWWAGSMVVAADIG